MTITPTAKEKLDYLLRDGEWLSIGLSGAGCAGLMLELTKADSPPTTGLSIEDHPKARWACATSREYLSGGKLDWVEDILSSRFDIKLPPGTESCGCGASIKL